MSKQTAVLYLRSATQRGEDDDALKVQEEALTEFARQEGYKVVEVYRDFGSGYTDNRTGLQALLADAKAGRFQTVIVWDHARLSRNYELTRQIEQMLAQLKAIVITPKCRPFSNSILNGHQHYHVIKRQNEQPPDD